MYPRLQLALNTAWSSKCTSLHFSSRSYRTSRLQGNRHSRSISSSNSTTGPFFLARPSECELAQWHRLISFCLTRFAEVPHSIRRTRLKTFLLRSRPDIVTLTTLGQSLRFSIESALMSFACRIYANEKSVGASIAASKADRSALYVTSKFDCIEGATRGVRGELEASLKDVSSRTTSKRRSDILSKKKTFIARCRLSGLVPHPFPKVCGCLRRDRNRLATNGSNGRGRIGKVSSCKLTKCLNRIAEIFCFPQIHRSVELRCLGAHKVADYRENQAVSPPVTIVVHHEIPT